jgi:superfamily I DNA/RNA helicase
MPDPWNSGVRGEQVLPLINSDAQTIRVEAGPGTGKTFGFVRRVERILHPQGLGAKGREVLVVAFNGVIAKQLLQEIHARLRTFEHDGDPAIRTIHALCVQVIGEDLRLLLPHERDALVYDLLQAFPVFRKSYGTAKKADQALRAHEARHADHLHLWQAARRWLERHHANLVGDLPGLLLDRLQGGDFPEQSYEFVIVDEFQDLTPGEQELMFRLRGDAGQLVALGDPRQSIYAFRGNDRQGLAKLDTLASAWGDGTILDVPMTECRRCPPPVVKAANRLMALSEALAMVPISDVAATFTS